MNGKYLLLLLLLAAVLFGAGRTQLSSATFTSQTANPTTTVRAAADWTPPTVTMTSPGSSVKGAVTLAATATDGETGVASVEIQAQAVTGGSWTTVCTDTASPYSCPWTTTAVADGQYDLRARATDAAGYAATSATTRTTVANSVVVVLGDPGEVVRGTVPLTATIYGGSSLTWTVTIEYAASGTTVWKTACGNLALVGGSVSCSWSTAAVTSGDYDLRAVAKATGGSSYTSGTVTVTVDNTAPAVTMTDPGSPLRGAVTLAATATDAESGVARVEIQYARGTGAYQSLCTVTVEPFTCRVDTTTLADGTYAFRAVATDVAGNATTSAAVTGRTIDNTVASVSVEDPGAYLTGTVTINATANSTAGVASVRIQAAPSGSTSWTDLCTDQTAPYACSWNTTTVAAGLYDLRAVLTDTRGTQTVSPTVTGRRVDNAPLRAVDVQTANGAGTAGRADEGDTITLTYSREVLPATIRSGWTGAATAVTVRLRDGNLAGLGTGNKGDTLDVLVGSTPVGLGSVNLKEDYVKSNKTATFNATMTAASVTVDGVVRTVVTVRIDSVVSSTRILRTVTTPAAMVWTPSASATGTDGLACSTAPATETGTPDREL
jgi:hypothetical protein